MCQGAEHTGTGVYSSADDMRVTKVGKTIRATSIDELPQSIFGAIPRKNRELQYNRIVELNYRNYNIPREINKL